MITSWPAFAAFTPPLMPCKAASVRLCPDELSAAKRSPVLQSARKASCPIHHQVHGLIVEGERQLKGGGKQLSRM